MKSLIKYSLDRSFEISPDCLTLTVEYDGIGLGSLEQLEKEFIHKKGHIGLLSIKNNVNWLNGTFKMIKSEKYTSGTSIRISIPLEVLEVMDEDTFN